MAEARLIYRSTLIHPVLLSQPVAARYLWVGLILLADDDGIAPAFVKTIRAGIFGESPIRNRDIESWLATWSELGMVELVERSRKRYVRFPAWRDFQKLRRPRSKTRRPEPAAPAPAPAAGSGSELRIAERYRDRRRPREATPIAELLPTTAG